MNIKVKGLAEQYLRVILDKGEKIIGEPDVLVAATGKVDVVAVFTEDKKNTENYFIAREDHCGLLLAPSIPGNVYVAKCDDGNSYIILKHSLFARTKNIKIEKKFNTQGKFEYIKATGNGYLCFSAFGEAYDITLDGKGAAFDDSHILGWQDSLAVEAVKVDTDKTIAVTDNKGMCINFEHGNLSGEDLILKFSGKGKIYFCTRNKDVYLKELVNAKAGK